MAILIVFLIVIVSSLIVYKQGVARRKYLKPAYLNGLQEIASFFEVTQTFRDYVTWVQRDQVKERFADTAKFFKGKSEFYRKEERVKWFNDFFQNFDSHIEQYNKDYIQQEKARLSGYFDDIEGKQLDEQQRTAVITDEHSNLIIAGAGSGKTLTIIGKVKYLLEQKNVRPEDILLLSFTKKTVEELNARLKNIGLNARATTFHRLGYNIIRNYKPTAPAVTNENTLTNVVKQYVETDIFEDPVALKAYILYVACYMNIPEENESFDSLGEKIDTEKGIDFESLKSKCDAEQLNIVADVPLDTIQGEKVKSLEELNIANFLYLNGINYEYERSYPFGTDLYRPDFYLPDFDIYLEHFGVDENNRAKWLTPQNEKKYVEGMDWKRDIHKNHGTKLLETYSYFNREHVLLEKLEELLKKEGVVFKPRDPKQIFAKISQKNKNFGKEIKKLVEAFINLSKSRQLDAESIGSLFLDKNKIRSKFMLERQALFIKFSVPILKRYDDTLKAANEIDFNDMINLATELVRAHSPAYSFTHIIIDEYQDISYARFNLIKQIRGLSGARLICVGDDWQSIYRFAGSDISLFSDFEKYVGKHEKLFIEQTYRNSQPLIDITSRYILKNQKQIQKSPRSRKEIVGQPISFVDYSENDAEDVLIREIRSIVDREGNKSILVLGRHSFDINDFIRMRPESRIRYYERNDKLEVKGFEDVDIRFITVHKSKGLEADNVVILNLKNHLLGFPNKIADDPMLALLLSDDENYRFAEERRLFYVALTRTKNKVVLLIPRDSSVFAKELMADNDFTLIENNSRLQSTNCPYCQTGHLVIREGRNGGNQFLGCSNYPRCTQTFNNITILENSILCSSCKSGFMVKRSGTFGSFLGCTSYPDCRNKMDLQ